MVARGGGWIVKGNLRDWEYDLVHIWKRKEWREEKPLANNKKTRADLERERDRIVAEFQSGMVPEAEKEARRARLKEVEAALT